MERIRYRLRDRVAAISAMDAPRREDGRITSTGASVDAPGALLDLVGTALHPSLKQAPGHTSVLERTLD
jgi:hypothetical protein